MVCQSPDRLSCKCVYLRIQSLACSVVKAGHLINSHMFLSVQGDRQIAQIKLYFKNILTIYTFNSNVPFEPDVVSDFVFALLCVCAPYLGLCVLLPLREVEDIRFALALFLRLRRFLRDLLFVLPLSEFDDLLLLMLFFCFVCLRRRVLLLLDAEELLLLSLLLLLLLLLFLLLRLRRRFILLLFRLVDLFR